MFKMFNLFIYQLINKLNILNIFLNIKTQIQLGCTRSGTYDFPSCSNTLQDNRSTRIILSHVNPSGGGFAFLNII